MMLKSARQSASNRRLFFNQNAHRDSCSQRITLAGGLYDADSAPRCWRSSIRRPGGITFVRSDVEFSTVRTYCCVTDCYARITTLHDRELQTRLESRLGTVHARQRLGIETDHERQVFTGNFSFFHLENWYSVHSLIRNSLKLVGLYARAARNALDIEVVENVIRVPDLPQSFCGLRILHLSDLHLDMSDAIAHTINERVRTVEYDLCVWTGDYRYRTYGDFEAVLQSVRNLRNNLTGPVYAVLGNHDSVKMVPEFEDADIRMLMNESVVIERDGAVLYLAGIDDAHFFGVGNIEKALSAVSDRATTILLSHTPEIYRLASHAGIDLLLCGHTHGGQICLPGGIPLTLDARIPRRFGRGNWRFGAMQGYTSRGAGSSIVDVRLNCRPEITVHELRSDQ